MTKQGRWLAPPHRPLPAIPPNQSLHRPIAATLWFWCDIFGQELIALLHLQYCAV